ncbi:hypothetical protein cyc_02107 [Cyclospora cayetanensis]|uniref:Uncharacterized protein n=1 Tax=Cyclospora cayetanensis TaxID=88456 RepID=A0A1D3CWP8_9EIME|nr:hypothetical protein cyc_02107 [Cyclospora cayetanensis]
MILFERRSPNAETGRQQIMSACTQAAAVLDTYRSVRKAFLDFHMEKDPHAGMSEDTSAWMVARFNLLLEEDADIAKDKNLKQCVKWCLEATLVVQKTLSQRVFSDFSEHPTSPGNAFNNLIDASHPGDISHSTRTAQFMLAQCYDQPTPIKAIVYSWAALSIGMAETFFKAQLDCAIEGSAPEQLQQSETQEQGQGRPIDMGLVKAAMAMSWGNMSLEKVLEPHLLVEDTLSNISNSKRLKATDKQRLQKNCGGIPRPDFQPFWPFFTEPAFIDEVLLAIFTVPSEESKEGKPAVQEPQPGAEQGTSEEPEVQQHPGPSASHPEEQIKEPTPPSDKAAEPQVEEAQGPVASPVTPRRSDQGPSSPRESDEDDTKSTGHMGSWVAEGVPKPDKQDTPPSGKVSVKPGDTPSGAPSGPAEPVSRVDSPGPEPPRPTLPSRITLTSAKDKPEEVKKEPLVRKGSDKYKAYVESVICG